jgi:hypothetical protein
MSVLLEACEPHAETTKLVTTNMLGPIMSSEGNLYKTRQGMTKCSTTGKN